MARVLSFDGKENGQRPTTERGAPSQARSRSVSSSGSGHW